MTDRDRDIQPITLPGYHHDVIFVELANLRQAAGVVRYHTEPMMPKQTIAHHSYNMAMMALRLWPEDHRLVEACLKHDTGEVRTGDIPAPAKWQWPQLKMALADAEFDAEKSLGTYMTLTKLQSTRLRFLDIFELAWFCAEQYAMGNTYAREIYKRILPAILDIFIHNPQEFPSLGEAHRLYEALDNFIGTCHYARS